MLLHNENDNGTTNKKAGLGAMFVDLADNFVKCWKGKKEYYQILENI